MSPAASFLIGVIVGIVCASAGHVLIDARRPCSKIAGKIRSWIGGELQRENWGDNVAKPISTKTIELAARVAEALDRGGFVGTLVAEPIGDGSIALVDYTEGFEIRCSVDEE